MVTKRRKKIEIHKNDLYIYICIKEKNYTKKRTVRKTKQMKKKRREEKTTTAATTNPTEPQKVNVEVEVYKGNKKCS